MKIETSSGSRYTVISAPNKKALLVIDSNHKRFSAVTVLETREGLVLDALHNKRGVFVTRSISGRDALGFDGTKATIDTDKTLKKGMKLLLFKMHKVTGVIYPMRLTTSILRIQ
jgi:hypothetical protein